MADYCIIGFDCPPADLCQNCKGSGDEPIRPDGANLCMTCDRCFDEVIGWSTGVEPGSESQAEAREFIVRNT